MDLFDFPNKGLLTNSKPTLIVKHDGNKLIVKNLHVKNRRTRHIVFRILKKCARAIKMAMKEGKEKFKQLKITSFFK